MKNIKIVILSAIVMATLWSCQKDEDSTPQGHTRPVTAKSSKWISQVLEFHPAPGQFLNESICSPEAAAKLIGSKSSMISLGGYGGYVIFGFDHSVINGDGVDFVIHGNAFNGNSEPGIVMVCSDTNGNGKADDSWYELAGEDYNNDKTVHNYVLTYHKPKQITGPADVEWTDKFGSGAIHSELIASFHDHSYWPLLLKDDPNTLTFTGTRLAPNTVQDPETTFWACLTVGHGYADNYSDDYQKVVNDDPDTKNSNKFDIASAVDASGRSVAINNIDFIKVYTGVNVEAGWLGEVSTEVCGAISLSVK